MALWVNCEPFSVASWTTSVLQSMVWEALNQTAHIVHPNKTLLGLKQRHSCNCTIYSNNAHVSSTFLVAEQHKTLLFFSLPKVYFLFL